MIYTLAEARTGCGRFVDSGSCTTAIIDARVNEALERLMAEEPWEVLRRVVRVAVEGKSFALPWNVETVLFADINGTNARVLPQPYQFIDAGPGDDYFRTCGASGYQDLEDLGDNWPIMYEIPAAFDLDTGATVGSSGWSLVAFSTEAADAEKEITFTGISGDEEVSESLAINRWEDGVEGEAQGGFGTNITVSGYTHTRIPKLTLPDDRASYVSLYAVDVTTNYMYFLAKYHPSQSIPQFRRYRITNKSCSGCTNVLLLVKLRYVPLVLATDILPVNSVQAIKLAVMSISKENAGEYDEAIKLMASAIRLLTKAQESSKLSSGPPAIVDTLRRMSLGNAMNRRVLL